MFVTVLCRKMLRPLTDNKQNQKSHKYDQCNAVASAYFSLGQFAFKVLGVQCSPHSLPTYRAMQHGNYK